jgi:hypothetical protein
MNNHVLAEHRKPRADKDHTFMYHNVVLPYDYTQDPSVLQRAEYDANLNVALLENPSEYQMAVSRSKVSTVDLPILMPEVSGGNTTWNLTMAYTTNSGATYTTRSLLVPWIQRQVLTTELLKYYPAEAVYDYNHVVDMMNAAFASLTATINSDLTLTLAVPIMEWDSATQKFSMVLDKVDYNDDLATHCSIRFNAEMEHVFQSFPFSYDFTSTRVGQELQLVQKVRINSYYPDPFDNTQALFQVEQEYVALSLWNPVQTIQVRTAMPIRSQFIPQDYVNRNNLNGVNIIRDYTPIVGSSSSNVRSYVVNFADEYEWNDMVGTAPLKHISASFYWQDIYGVSRQLLITKHATNTLKLVFRRKIRE